jgi:hypothetical protein
MSAADRRHSDLHRPGPHPAAERLATGVRRAPGRAFARSRRTRTCAWPMSPAATTPWWTRPSRSSASRCRTTSSAMSAPASTRPRRHLAAQQDWQHVIAASWGGRDGPALNALIADIDGLLLQEPSKQGPCKLSYYTPEDWDRPTRLAEIEARFERARHRREPGLEPGRARRHRPAGRAAGGGEQAHGRAMADPTRGLGRARTVCAGDSGNDLAMLTGPINAVLVANATADVRADAAGLAEAAGLCGPALPGQGDFHGMNGCYAAGILEGLAHYLPETASRSGRSQLL